MELNDIIKRRYGEAARRVANGGSTGCCGGSALLQGSCDPITSNLYDHNGTNQIPGEALRASLGCGNPTALAKLNPGETVLDLGSGGGIDVLPSNYGHISVEFGFDGPIWRPPHDYEFPHHRRPHKNPRFLLAMWEHGKSKSPQKHARHFLAIGIACIGNPVIRNPANRSYAGCLQGRIEITGSESWLSLPVSFG
jgi:hypothetical protein